VVDTVSRGAAGEMVSSEAAVMVRPVTIEVEDWPIPVAKENQVLVEASAVGVCGSRVHYFTEGGIGIFVVEEQLFSVMKPLAWLGRSWPPGPIAATPERSD
jgi:hypothetical protein